MIDRIPMPNRTFMALAIVVLFALDGLWRGTRMVPHGDWYVQAAYIAGDVAGGSAKGALIGGFLWLCAKGAAGFRLKAPAPWVTRLGVGIYLLGSAICVYFIGWAIYVLFSGLARSDSAVESVVFVLAEVALFYWFASRAASYVLGR